MLWRKIKKRKWKKQLKVQGCGFRVIRKSLIYKVTFQPMPEVQKQCDNAEQDAEVDKACKNQEANSSDGGPVRINSPMRRVLIELNGGV